MEQLKIQKGIAIFKRFNADLSKPIYFINQQGNEVTQCNQSMFILPIFQIALRMNKFKGVEQVLQRQYKKVQKSVLEKFQNRQGYTFLKVIQEQNMMTYQNYQLMKYVDLNFIQYPEGEKIQCIAVKEIQQLVNNNT